MTGERAVNTVADVSLALVLITAAVALVATAPTEEQSNHDPAEADRTTTVVSTATLHVPYSLESVVAAADTEEEYDTKALQRVSHGTVADVVADAAVADFGCRDGDQRLTPAGAAYERAIAERFEARFVGSNFETNVTARWEPYEGSELSGTVTVGQPVPPDTEYSSVQLSVPSGFEGVQAEGGDAVDREHDFGAVARPVARALVEGYLPPLEAKRALEGSGLDRALTVARYEGMAALVEGADPTATLVTSNLDPTSADPAAVNEYLIRHLSSQIADDMAAEYDSAQAAAAGVSTAEVTVIVRTWEP